MPALYRATLLIVSLVLLAGPALAQQRAAERPATQRAPDAFSLDRVARIEMPTVDNDALIGRDEAVAARATEPRPFRFAEPFEVSLSADNAGTWETLDDGTRVWRLVIASNGAYSINLGFSRFRLPDGAALWLYPAGEAPSFRAFTSADNEAHGELWTPIVSGGEIVVELNLPAAKPGAEPDVELEIGQVNHAYRPFGIDRATWDEEALARSGSCNVDVVCPEGNGYRDIIRSVGAYTLNGFETCSGSAVNTTAGSGAPYFLTADHCGINASNDATMVIYWNYENSTCRPPGSPQSGGSGDGTRDQFSTGVTFLGDSGGGTGNGSDWTLVETDDPIPPEFSVFLNGWDRRDQATASAIGIHHPGVEEKRISFENDPTSVTNYLEAAPNANGTHVRITDWDVGTTEGGSSGSPLFSPEKRVIGQLSGGFASCSSQTSDWYGRMARNMTSGLATFLDPGNTGAEFIEGAEAGNPPGPIQLLAVMDADPISVSPGGTTTITVEVFNNGTEAAESVGFENGLPEFLAFAGNLSASAGDAAESGGTVTWTVDVGPDDSETISFDVTVDEDAPGLPITNTSFVDHPSLNLPLQPSVTIDVFVAPDYFYSNETGIPIPDNACPSFTTSEIEVDDMFEPINVKVGVNMQHTWRGDLIIELTSPEGTTIRLLGGVGSSADNLDALFSDSGPAGVFGSGDHDPSAPFYDVEGQTQGSGMGPLAPFLDEDPQGTWTLSVCDDAGQDVGSLNQWALLFYTENLPPVGTEDGSAMVGAYRIDAAYPNPFAEEAIVRFAVRDAQPVRAEVYDALGRRVQVLHDGPVAAEAEQTLRIDGRGLAGGVYVVRVTGETFTASQRVVLVK